MVSDMAKKGEGERGGIFAERNFCDRLKALRMANPGF